MPVRDSAERFATDVLLRGGGGDSVRVSRSAVQFWIHIIVTVLTISAWGMMNRSDLAQLSAQLTSQAAQITSQKEKTDLLEKKIELLRYDMSQLQVAVMSGATAKGDNR